MILTDPLLVDFCIDFVFDLLSVVSLSNARFASFAAGLHEICALLREARSERCEDSWESLHDTDTAIVLAVLQAPVPLVYEGLSKQRVSVLFLCSIFLAFVNLVASMNDDVYEEAQDWIHDFSAYVSFVNFS